VLRAEVEGTLDQFGAEVDGDVPSPEQMVAAAADVAALLHHTVVELDHRLDVGGVGRSLTGQITSLAPLAPALGQWLQGALDVAVADLSRTNALPATLCHGDFTYTQLLFDGSSPGLIDFDTVALAEPSVDLGHFTAYVRLACEKAGRGAATERADQLCRQFLDRAAAQYHGESDVLLQRATAFELISLVRIAVHSWHKMKAARLGLVLPLIRRSVTHLSGVDPGVPTESLDAIL
jgi:aminoglycoside phosphotransferase (APT) family kinase protein